jgi:uncharacterized membrane protein YeaQ/YmgE (transglycosylase-associated protein family)
VLIAPRATVRAMGPLTWVAMGLIAGSLARWAVKDDRSGCLYTTIVGVLGALIGGAIAQAAGKGEINDFSIRSLIIAFLGACLLLLALQALNGRMGRSSKRSR